MTTIRPRPILLCALALCAAAAIAVLVSVGSADADLNSRIQTQQSRAESLRAAVATESARIRSSASGIAAARRRLNAIQADVNAQQATLARIEVALRRARDRLTRLVNRQRQATDALRANLLADYRDPRPDIVSVVISAKGFTDLLEQADFLKRVARQNATIMDAARTSRVAVAKQANMLATMQARELRLETTLEDRRDRAQALQSALLREQARRLAGRAAKAGALHRVQGRLASLRKRLARMARPGIRTNAGGMAQAPPGAPAAVGLVMAAGNAIAGLPYVYGGGHGGFQANAYDCSGSVSYALAAGGLVSSSLVSGAYENWGDAGPGRWVTLYANADHIWMEVAGWRFDTVALAESGTRWARGGGEFSGFVVRHPPGL